LALIFSDILSIIVPALFSYTFYDIIDGVYVMRFRTIFGIILFALSFLFWSQTLHAQYSIRRSFYDEFIELSQIYLFNGLAALAALFMFSLSDEKAKHIIFLSLVFVLIPFLRELTRILLNKFGLWQLQCLLICPPSEQSYAIAAIESQFHLGMSIKRSDLEQRMILRLLRNIDQYQGIKLSKLKQMIQTFHSKIGSPHIILFVNNSTISSFPKLVDVIVLCDLPYSIIPDVGGASLLGMRISHFFRWELLLITPRHNISRMSYRLIKRIVDIIFSISLISILFLPMLLIYALIKFDGGPGFFFQDRIGLNGKIFKIIKFRSMKINSESEFENYLNNNPEARAQWNEIRKLEYDPRITKIGSVLRATSLDELPQLVNVIWGEMSLVGPRPIIKDEIKRYGKEIEMYYKVRPGMTGLWQISGRSSTKYEYRVALDVWYIKNWSIWYDIGILFKTINIVLSKSGAH